MVSTHVRKSETMRTCAGVSPDERDKTDYSVAIATNTASVRVYDAKDSSYTFLCGHSAIVLCMSVSSDLCFLVTAGKDKTARLWDLRTMQCVAVMTGASKSEHNPRPALCGACS